MWRQRQPDCDGVVLTGNPHQRQQNLSVLLTVTDSAGASTTLPVNMLVGANLIPTLGTYGNINMNLNATTTVTPSAAIADGNNNLVAARLVRRCYRAAALVPPFRSPPTAP